MKMLSFIVFIAICFSHSTTGLVVRRGSYNVFIKNHILNSVQPMHSRSECCETVDLSGLDLRKIEEDAFRRLVNVKNLNIANNNLTEFSYFFSSEMGTLETITFANNNLRSFPTFFIGLKKLQTLDLSNNQISTFKRMDLLGIPKSTNVIMEGNSIGELTIQPLDDPSLIPGMPAKSVPVDPYPWDALYFYEGRSVVRGYNTYSLENKGLKEIIPELLEDVSESVHILNLKSNKIEIIKENVIQNSFLQKLSLDYNKITEIEDNAFKATKLISISLNSNNLENLDFTETLPSSILELMLANNRIAEISIGDGTNLGALRRFIIPYNRITHACSCTLRGLKELRLIDLSHNLLENLDRKLFRDQEKLIVLKLSYNKIKVLPPGIFKNLKEVQKIELTHNAIKTISRNSFLGLQNYPIYEIKLQNNQIDTIEEGSFAHMIVELLQLEYNNISENSIVKGAFESCTLFRLQLWSNSFTGINGDSFYGIRIFGEIELNFNQIKSIGKTATKYMEGVQALNLGMNPIERLESGSLYPFRRRPYAKIILNREVEIIEGGVFEDV